MNTRQITLAATALLALLGGSQAQAANTTGEKDVVINGTGKSVVLNIASSALNGKEVTATATSGFTVEPAKITASGKARLTVKLTSSKDTTRGTLVLRCGDVRRRLPLVGLGTPLPVKTLAAKDMSKGEKTSLDLPFKPGKNGYTIEFRLRSMDDGQTFKPYFVDAAGHGFQTNITFNGVALQNSYEKALSDPATAGMEGGGRFYNNDGLAHTYRIAVTPDDRAFIYRDGTLLTCARTRDFAPRSWFATPGKGKPQENLLKNGDFEGEYNLSADRERAEQVEGWDVVIGDRWNSEQNIKALGLDNTLDVDNHVFWIRPYKWRAGWSDGILEQVVDVVPGETYTLEALAKGGTSAKQGKNTGKLRICEVQDRSKNAETVIASEEWEMYSVDYAVPEDCHQIAVQITVGRDKWGGDLTPVYADNVRLTGTPRLYTPKFGFRNENAEIDYFTIDESGAYAPETPTIDVQW